MTTPAFSVFGGAVTAARVVGHRSGVIRVASDEILPVSDLLLTGGQIHVELGRTLFVPAAARLSAPHPRTGCAPALSRTW